MGDQCIDAGLDVGQACADVVHEDGVQSAGEVPRAASIQHMFVVLREELVLFLQSLGRREVELKGVDRSCEQ